MKQNGYKVYGWDLEWRNEAFVPIETPDQMLELIKQRMDRTTSTKTSGKFILLTHDLMFRASQGHKVKLQEFMAGLKRMRVPLKTMADY